MRKFWIQTLAEFSEISIVISIAMMIVTWVQGPICSAPGMSVVFAGLLVMTPMLVIGLVGYYIVYRLKRCEVDPSR